MTKPASTSSKLTLSGLPGRRARIAVEKPKDSKKVIFRLWQYLIQEKSLLLFIMILLLINTGATLMGSYLLRPIINNYILPHNIPGLIRMICLLLSIYIIGSIAAIWQNRLMISVAQKTVSVIRADLFSKLQTCH